MGKGGSRKKISRIPIVMAELDLITTPVFTPAGVSLLYNDHRL